MANGTTCCALEICCPPASARARTIEALVAFTGADADCCGKMLDWMAHEGLVFAPESFKAVLHDLVAMARRG